MNDEKVAIYVCTHKEFDTSRLDDCYNPLLCGAYNLDDNFGYLTDDTGENISSLNKYYAELTGQYWVWKNSKADIIGFCHYRRYFCKNILLKDYLTEKDIKNILESYDIIVQHKVHFHKPLLDFLDEKANGVNYLPKINELNILREIINENSPDYLDSFDKIMNGNVHYQANMFICKRDIANNYFQWLFNITEKLREQIDYSEYNQDNLRLLGVIGEFLLTIYIDKNNLNTKEMYVLHSESIAPHYFCLLKHSTLLAKIHETTLVRTIIERVNKLR